MFRIFISYRRGDTRDVTQRLFERISKHFPNQVFCDVNKIKLGSNYQEVLAREAERCDVMIIMIGPSWKGENPDGTRRIDDPNDWVHKEVKLALQRKETAIPVLVYPAKVLHPSELPEPISELASIEAIPLYTDRQFESSVQTLIEELHSAHESRSSIFQRGALKFRRSAQTVTRPMSLAAIIIVAVVASYCVFWYQRTFDKGGRRIDPTIVNSWEAADRLKLQKEIDAILLRPATPDFERDPNTESEPTLGSPDYGGFDILSDERFWDLRGWKDIRSGAKGDDRSFAVMTRTIRIYKASDSHEIRFESRTDGDEVFLRCLSPKEGWREIVQKQSSFVGARQTKVRQLALDVSGVPVHEEFVVRSQATFINSLQDPNDRWLGAIGYPRSDRIRIVVLLPKQRPLQGFKLQVAQSTRDKPVEYQGPRRLIEAKDGMSLMWEIPSPESGKVYSMVLDW